MNATLTELAQSALCTAAFALFLLAPGFVVARLLNLHRMRERSAGEQLLWSVALSLSLALVLSELVGRVLNGLGVLAVFLLFLLTAIALIAVDLRAAPKPLITAPQRSTRIAFAAMALLAAYILLALLNIQSGSRLFVPTVLFDWAVRVPMVASAMHGPVPPINPLSGIGPAPVPLRYYYFWYVLCAQPARMLHIPAHAALAASSVWAALSLVATTFLSLKYLVGLRQNLRRRCLLALLPLTVIGLDILPTLAILLSHTGHPFLDMEWWHNDRTPALLTTLLYAPHHIAGLVCCIVAMLVLTSTHSEHEAPPSTTQLCARAFVAGIAFSACAGTSTFLAFIFVFVCLFWAVDLLRTRQFRLIAALAGTGISAWLLTRPFLHEMGAGSSAAHGFAAFAWRSSDFTQAQFAKHHVLTGHPIAAFFARQPAILTLDFFELGFFAFVLAHQLRTQFIPALRGRLQLTAGQRTLWAIFFGAGTVALFLSSSVTLSANDLGMHAGIVVRFVLVLWSVPYLEDLWSNRRRLNHAPITRKLSTAAALLCLALGLIGGLYGAAMNRLYFPLLESRTINRPIDVLTADRLSYRLFAIRSMWRTLDTLLPANARVQFNPTGTMQPAFSVFSNRQIVASDSGCGTAFGGDYTSCAPIAAQLHHLFGTVPTFTLVNSVPVYAPAATTADVAELRSTCRQLRIDTILVESTDPIWQQPTSWVWTVKPLLTAPTVRAYACDQP